MGLRRLNEILGAFGHYRLDLLLPDEALPRSARLLINSMPWFWHREPGTPAPERLRMALESLGPVFVKFGQLLSTRPDLIGPDYASALSQLQDRCQPFDGQLARRLVEAGLKRPLADCFSSFSETPLASASVAQVHLATLPDGDEVVVKVIRPGIRRQIDGDVRLMHWLASLLERFWRDGRRLRLLEVVNDYRHTLLDELDLQKEAANTSQLRRNFENSSLLYIPRVIWSHVGEQILTTERIEGVPVSDLVTIDQLGFDRKKLAERGVEIFFTQVFRDSFFHADMHPGNVFINTQNPSLCQYIALDCGIMGSLTHEDQSYLARNLLAFFRQDYRLVAQLHIDSGWVPANTPVNEFEMAIRTVCEPIFQRPLREISFGHFLLKLFQTARRFNMQVQPQLVLLQKTLINIEGLGRQLYPQLDLWSTAHPYLEQWMKQRIGPGGLIKQLHQEAPDLLEDAPLLLRQTISRIQQLRSLPVSTGQPEQATSRRSPSGTVFQATGWILLAGGVLSGTPEAVQWLTGAPWYSLVLLGAGIVVLARQK